MTRVTVFMPVYNAEKYLDEAISSILKQTYQDFILLIINDGSTDNSDNIIKKYVDPRIKVVENDKNEGVVYTRNRGLDLCETEYIAFMDADDVAPPNRLKLEVEYLDAHPEIVGVGGYAQSIDEKGKLLNKLYPTYLNPRYIKAHMMFENTIANGTVLIRYEVIKKNNIRYCGGYFGEDYRFFCEVLKYGLIANMNEIMQMHREVSTSLTQQSNKNLSEKWHFLSEIYEMNYAYYGFKLTEDQKSIIRKAFLPNSKVENKKEINDLYNALKEYVEQAYQNNIDVADEIKIMCRKQFGKAISKATWLW